MQEGQKKQEEPRLETRSAAEIRDFSKNLLHAANASIGSALDPRSGERMGLFVAVSTIQATLEVAAQLAELNERLASIIVSTGTGNGPLCMAIRTKSQ